MKKTVIALTLFTITFSAFAQDDEEQKGFKKENLFTGGSVTLSFFNGATILGASPIFGYKIANWVDAGVVANYIYSGQRDVTEFDDKVRQYVYGGGVFTRIYPVNFLFLQAQFEHNFTKLKYIPAPGSVFYSPYKETFDASSFLVGAGYTQGRGPGSNTFYYVSILFDVIKDQHSPYVDLAYNPNTGGYSVRAVPIIRAGFNIGLFEGRDRR